jgi:hypothetical protein
MLADFSPRCAAIGAVVRATLVLVLLAAPRPGSTQSIQERALQQVVPGSCPSTPASDTTGSVLGQVRDQATGVAVGLSPVWLVPEDESRSASVRSDAAGRFTFCDVQPGAYIVRAAVRGLGSARASVEVFRGRRAEAVLELHPDEEASATGGLQGRVVAASDGQPISGAEVRLLDRFVRVSGSDGSFSFTDVAGGTATLDVSRLGYAAVTGTVVIGGGQTLTVRVRLSEQPIALDPIVVEAVRSTGGGVLAEVRRRAELPWGTVLIGETLERKLVRATRTTDVLAEHQVTTYDNATVLYLDRSRCAPHVYVDGVKVTHITRGQGLEPARDIEGAEGPEREAARAVNMVEPSAIAAIEIYQGPAETPGQYLDSDSQCGVILIWTRRGTDVRRRDPP